MFKIKEGLKNKQTTRKSEIEIKIDLEDSVFPRLTVNGDDRKSRRGPGLRVSDLDQFFFPHCSFERLNGPRT